MERVEFTEDSLQAASDKLLLPLARKGHPLWRGGRRHEKYIITGDRFLCQYAIRKWKKPQSNDTAPTIRAVHNAISIEHFFFVFRGDLGEGKLADGNLYQLDFLTTTDNAFWAVKNCKESTPKARNGHVMAYLKPYIIIYEAGEEI